MAGEATLTRLEDCVDRIQFESTPTRRLMLAYNATPLQVAADLSQLAEVTDEQSELYRKRVVPFLNGVQTASDGDRFSTKIA